MESKSNADMKPIFIIFQLLALYPLPSHAIYTIFTIASFSVGIWVLISLLYISPIFVNGSLRIFIGHIIFIVRIIVPMTVIAQAYCTRSKQMEMFQILNGVDKAFEKTVDRKRLRSKYFFSFFAPMVALVVVRIYFLHHLLTDNTDTNFRFYWFHCVQSLLVSRTRCLQVSFYANLVNDRILWIHQELAKIMRRKHLSQKKLQAKIMFLRRIYTMLYDVSVLINGSFGWSLLIITISYFIDSVGNCYMFYLVAENLAPNNNRIVATVGFITTSIALVTLCYSCGHCAENASATYELIGKVLSHKVIWTSDYQLQEFMLQVRHQNVVITGKDFFTIDMNLLASIISATVTYIIVVIQA